MAETTFPLGIDIGGSGIKGAPVDLATGEFAADRLRIETPGASTPEAVVDVVARIADHFADLTGQSPIGVTVPAAVTHGVVRTAANIDKSWIGTDAETMLSQRLGRPVSVINDADAAGVGELQYGAAKNAKGLVFVATLGTGIGTAMLVDGVLVPNTELGHLEIDGFDAESRASSAARDVEDLSWKQWAKRLQRYFGHVEALFWPDLFVIGGGISKKSAKFLPLLELRTPIIPAQLLNNAGIIGAAWHATAHQETSGDDGTDEAGGQDGGGSDQDGA